LFKNAKRIRQATLLYWLLFFYTIIALVWWFISLEKQNVEKTGFEISTLKATVSEAATPGLFLEKQADILYKQKRRTTKHIAEGVAFLFVIIIGAVFVYRAVKKQLKLNRQQQNFIMAITHELKTPIAISKLNIETLQKRQLDDITQKKFLSNTLTEMHRLNDLVNNILIVSQIETGDYIISKDYVNISQILEILIAELKHQHPSRNFEPTIEKNITVIGDALLLKLVFSNLIDNALKYSPKSSTVTVVLIQNPNALFMVKDFGHGISNEEKQKVFEKFYRTGNENTRNTKGTGLGLYLCKKILTDHKATITIEDNVPNGSIFKINF
jgi:two-component system, OmpR family, sensor histidine kinase CiaH